MRLKRMENENPRDRRLTDDFDPLAPESFTSAHLIYKEMRQSCPVPHSNEWDGFWALLRHADVVGVRKDFGELHHHGAECGSPGWPSPEGVLRSLRSAGAYGIPPRAQPVFLSREDGAV